MCNYIHYYFLILDDLSIGFSTSSFSPFTRFKQSGLLLRDQLIIQSGDLFTINEFTMWRGPQKDKLNKQFDQQIINKNTCDRSNYDECLKLRLRYSFINEYMKATDRQCAYTLNKYVF